MWVPSKPAHTGETWGSPVWADGGHVPDGREVEQVAVRIRDNSHETTVALGYR